MTPEKDLGRLLTTMSPELRPGSYVFVTLPRDVGTATATDDVRTRTDDAREPLADMAAVRPVVVVEEDEGTTWVLERATADRLGLAYDFVAAQITLRVHSALEAVGLTAAVATCLAQAGISCNVVAGFHHDHLFVPVERGEEAVDLLRRLAETAGDA